MAGVVPQLLAIGDSHTCYFGMLSGVVRHYRGPITMHRVGRDGLQDELPSGANVLLSYGEIDCSHHVAKIAKLQAVSIDHVLTDLVGRFYRAVKPVTDAAHVGVAMCCVVPPGRILYSGDALDEQIFIRSCLNAKLAVGAAENGFHFLDYYTDYQAADGCLIHSDGPGNHIYHPDDVGAVIDKVKEIGWC